MKFEKYTTVLNCFRFLFKKKTNRVKTLYMYIVGYISRKIDIIGWRERWYSKITLFVSFLSYATHYFAPNLTSNCCMWMSTFSPINYTILIKIKLIDTEKHPIKNRPVAHWTRIQKFRDPVFQWETGIWRRSTCSYFWKE